MVTFALSPLPQDCGLSHSVTTGLLCSVFKFTSEEAFLFKERESHFTIRKKSGLETHRSHLFSDITSLTPAALSQLVFGWGKGGSWSRSPPCVDRGVPSSGWHVLWDNERKHCLSSCRGVRSCFPPVPVVPDVGRRKEHTGRADLSSRRFGDLEPSVLPSELL